MSDEFKKKRTATIQKELDRLLALKEQYKHLSESGLYATLLADIKRNEAEIEFRAGLKRLKEEK
jgi:hypothetical protein